MQSETFHSLSAIGRTPEFLI